MKLIKIHFYTHSEQVLSFSNNRMDDISFVCNLFNLKVLKCDRNRVSHLPKKLVNLQELQVGIHSFFTEII